MGRNSAPGGLACLERLHVFLTLHEVGVLLRHRLHLLLHGEVLIQQRHVQLVQRVDGADVALHDAAQGFRLFLELGDFPVSVLDLGEQPIDALLLRGEFRHHHAVLRLEGVVGETHFFEVEDELVLLGVSPALSSLSKPMVVLRAESCVPDHQHQTRHEGAIFWDISGWDRGWGNRRQKIMLSPNAKVMPKCGANPVR